MLDQHATKGAKTVCLVLLMLAGASSHAQAPIQERGAPAPAVEGARIGSSAARNAREAAERRHAEADSRHKAAAARFKEAQVELDSANRERTESARQLEAARKTEAEANAVLDRALKK